MRSKATEEVLNDIGQQKVNQILKTPKLLDVIIDEINKLCIGQRKAKISIFMNLCQIFVMNPHIKLHQLVNADSSAGKSFMTRQILKFFPKTIERKGDIKEGSKTDNIYIHRRIMQVTRTTPRAFDYYPHEKVIEKQGFSWDNTIVFLDDPDEDVLNSSSMKTWLTEGQSTLILNKQVAKYKETPGIPNLIITFAEGVPENQILNRQFLIKLEESPEQTQAIIEFTSKRYRGETSEKPNPLIQAALNNLRIVPVIVPFTDRLEQGLFPIDNVQVHRYYPMFLELIKCSTALHQRQREFTENGYLATGDDYNNARYVLLSMFEGEDLNPLTHKQRKIYQACKKKSKELQEETMGWFAVKDVAVDNPNLGEKKTFYRTLSKLSEKGYFETKIDKNAESVKKPTLYRPLQSRGIELPKYSEL